MATDWWPSQEGRLVDGVTLNCIAEDGSIVEGQAVCCGTDTAGQFTVDGASGLGDGWGVALKASAAAGDPLPVLTYGVYKMTVSNGTAQPGKGEMVMNSSTIYVTSVNDCGETYDTLYAFAGASYILGMVLIGATATGDEIPILVGKCI
jgi:hypothetical protein